MPSEAHPVRVLMEEADPIRRCAAHLVLGQRAITRDDVVTATDHFREAAELDPTDERPRAALLDIEGLQSDTRSSWGRTIFGWLFTANS
jgi:hypothetical protein